MEGITVCSGTYYTNSNNAVVRGYKQAEVKPEPMQLGCEISLHFSLVAYS